MISKKEIIEEYNNLCNISNKQLSRNEYRKLNPKFTSSFIENLFGSWTNFIKEVKEDFLLTRSDIIKTVKKNVDKVVISFVHDGTVINEKVLKTLELYCKENNAELYILWGKGVKKNKTFDITTYNLISKYLATKVILEKDKGCLIQDFLIPHTQKNPFLNIDKLTTDIYTVIIGSAKQYLRMLPYKQYNSFRVAYSTGTISNIDYGYTVSRHLDEKNHTFGAICLEYSNKYNKYIPRNLIYNEGSIYDLNKEYTYKKSYTHKEVEGMVLGDLHLPETDKNALNNTLTSINNLHPKNVLIHDIASWNSISHHEFNLPFTRLKNKTTNTISLKVELESVIEGIKYIADSCKKTTFNIIHSNHDEFIRKFLEKDFINDTVNARLGAELFIKYLDGKTILEDYLPKNFKQLPKNTSFKIAGFEVNEHGDCGISGLHGNNTTFNRGFEKLIHGHTHSPEIYEKVVAVGTLSNLKLSYNQQGLTKWMHANAIIYKNSTFQLIFI